MFRLYAILYTLTVFHVTDVLLADDVEEQDKIKDEESAFDKIADVNSKSANLMPKDFDRYSDGLFEYDIMRHGATHEKIFGPNKAGAEITSNLDPLWGNKIVYYSYAADIASESSGKTAQVIQQAMMVFQQKTCITFKKRTSETHYIEFFKEAGCWSMIGRVGGKQQISLGYGCEEVGVVIHEMMHALGFWHEQSRTDRDKYIKIVFLNVVEGMEGNFKKYETGVNYGSSPYDLSSVMHYGVTAFSKDRSRLETILVKDSTYSGSIGQVNDLSLEDVKRLNTLYRCPTNKVTVDGQWGHWSTWSACDLTCGGGRKMKSRSCSSPPPSNDGKACLGDVVETQTCNIKGCSGPVHCNFDVSNCFWGNFDGDNMDWRRRRGSTFSRGTGPDSDHTTGTGSYIYMETSSAQVGHHAILQSITLSGSRCFRFYYSMYGAEMGELNIYVKYPDSVKLIWSLKGNKGKGWQEASVPINSPQVDFKIRVEGVRGNGYRGDIALDDFDISVSSCVVQPTEAIPSP